MRRYYARRLNRENVQLIRTFEGKDEVLAEAAGGWTMGQTYCLGLQVRENRLVGTVDDKIMVEAHDPDHRYTGGGMALFAEAGRMDCDWVEVSPPKL